MLKYLKVKHTYLKDNILKLLASIHTINLDNVTVSGGVSLENCTRLDMITLKHVDLKDNTLHLPASIRYINFDNVIVTGVFHSRSVKTFPALQ